MSEKIILFGTGEQLQFVSKIITLSNEFDVTELWDNDNKKYGKKYVVNGKEIRVCLPHFQNDYNIVITSDMYFDEIKNGLVKKYNILSDYIKRYTYIYREIKNEILQRYKGSEDEDIKKICEYLKENDLDVFCGQIKEDYPLNMFAMNKDSDNGLLYSYWDGKKIYLSSKYESEKKAQRYLCSLCKEQDVNSPHYYDIDNLVDDEMDVVIDGGAAEGFFALQVIDKVKHVYLVECDEQWVEALKYTFEPYKDKVTIINKAIDVHDSDKSVTLDSLLSTCEKKSKVLVKLDIEGMESDGLKGTQITKYNDMDITYVVCTYHKSEDAREISSQFKIAGFDISFSKGYMFFPYLDEVKPELRKGVLTAVRKQNMNNMEE